MASHSPGGSQLRSVDWRARRAESWASVQPTPLRKYGPSRRRCLDTDPCFARVTIIGAPSGVYFIVVLLAGGGSDGCRGRGGKPEVRCFHSDDRHRRSPHLPCSLVALRSSNRTHSDCGLALRVSRPEPGCQWVSLVFYKPRAVGWSTIHRRRYCDAIAAARSVLPLGVEY
jgi:hypothetical protein